MPTSLRAKSRLEITRRSTKTWVTALGVCCAVSALWCGCKYSPVPAAAAAPLELPPELKALSIYVETPAKVDLSSMRTVQNETWPTTLPAIFGKQLKDAGFRVVDDRAVPHDVDLSMSVVCGAFSLDSTAKLKLKSDGRRLDEIVETISISDDEAGIARVFVDRVAEADALIALGRARAASVGAPKPTGGGADPSATVLPAGITSIAVLPITGKGAVSKDVTSILDDLLPAAISKSLGKRIKVITRTDIDAMLSMEKTKDAVGCESTVCAVEIAGALGVESIITASLGVLGKKHMLTVVWIDQRTATVIARHNQSLGENPSEFDTGVEAGVSALVAAAAAPSR
jgi:hypothetical protein